MAGRQKARAGEGGCRLGRGVARAVMRVGGACSGAAQAVAGTGPAEGESMAGDLHGSHCGECAAALTYPSPRPTPRAKASLGWPLSNLLLKTFWDPRNGSTCVEVRRRTAGQPPHTAAGLALYASACHIHQWARCQQPAALAAAAACRRPHRHWQGMGSADGGTREPLAQRGGKGTACGHALSNRSSHARAAPLTCAPPSPSGLPAVHCQQRG